MLISMARPVQHSFLVRKVIWFASYEKKVFFKNLLKSLLPMQQVVHSCNQ